MNRNGSATVPNFGRDFNVSQRSRVDLDKKVIIEVTSTIALIQGRHRRFLAGKTAITAVRSPPHSILQNRGLAGLTTRGDPK